MTRLSINLLGSFNVTLDGQEARGFESDKARGLLAYLAVEGIQPQRRDKLTSLFWSEQPEGRARASLSQALYNLRTVLHDKAAPQPILITTPQTVQFNQHSDSELDTSAFNNLLVACQQHAHPRIESCPECLDRLQKVSTLYRGDFLAGFHLANTFEFEDWLMLNRERLRQKALEALAWQITYYENNGETGLALDYAQRVVSLDPLWETGQRSMIRLLALSGQRQAALNQYQALYKLLEKELDVEPESETQALYQRLQREAQGAVSVDNLPTHLTPFIGRRSELTELSRLLRDPVYRLVTVLGPGGSGKTRLALKAAEGLRYNFPDGEYLVPLSGLSSAAGLAPAIAEAIGFQFREGRDAQAQLEDYLRGKRLLLVLDSYETVLESARWLSELLRAAPHIKALVTSRARLNVKAEQLFLLGGMHYPEPGMISAAGIDARKYSAMQLFQTNAQRKQPHLEWGADSWREVARICRLVQGMPLGLLLASAWVGSYSLLEIAEEIEHSLDFLIVDWKDAPERQQSLRATMDYSWRLLSQAERNLLCRLSVFQGGFTRQAAGIVVGAAPQALQGLVDKSMLELRPPRRYGLHDLLRQYAMEKLVENPDLEHSAKESHASYFLGKLPEWSEGLKCSKQGDVLAQMDAETGNLSAAWIWAAENQCVNLLDMGLEGLVLFASLRARYQEGLIACQFVIDKLALLEPSPDLMRLFVKINVWKSHFQRLLGRHTEATRLLMQNLKTLHDIENMGLDIRAEQAFLLLELGNALITTDRLLARNYLQRSLAQYEEIGDAWQQARSLAGLGMVAFHSGTFEEAVQLYERSLAFYEKLGDQKAVADVLIELGQNSLRQGLLDEGKSYIYRGVEIYERIGDQVSVADSMLQLSRMCFWTGDFKSGITFMKKARPVFDEFGLLENYTFTLIGESIPQTFLTDFDAARKCAREGGEVAQANGFLRFQAASKWVLGMVELVDGELPLAHSHLRQSIDVFQTIAQNDELGWALAALAYAELGMGNIAEFHRRLCEALKLGIKIHGLFTILLALSTAAMYLSQHRQINTTRSEAEDLERAIELYTLVRRYPTVANAPWFERAVGVYVAAAAESLLPEIVEIAREKGRSADLFQTAEQLVDEFCPSVK